MLHLLYGGSDDDGGGCGCVRGDTGVMCGCDGVAFRAVEGLVTVDGLEGV